MKSQSKLQSDKQDKLKVLNDDINEINQQTSVLKSTVIEFRADAYKPVLSAEKKKKKKEQPSKMLNLLLRRLML